jgi:hypothetical protein
VLRYDKQATIRRYIVRSALTLLSRSLVLASAGLLILVSLAFAQAAGAASVPVAPTISGPAESPVAAQSETGLFSWTEGYTLVLLSTEDARSFAVARDAVQAAGARVAVAVPPGVVLGWVPAEREAAVLSVPGVEGLYRAPVPQTVVEKLRGRDETNATAVQFFNSVASGVWRQELLRQRDESLFSPSGERLEREPLIKDSFEPPELNLDAYLENLRSAGYDATAEAERLSGGGSVFEVLGNSDDMVGTVTVTLFFVESDGSIDPNTYTWGTTQLNNTVSSAISGLSWWVSKAATYGKTVSFTVYYFPGTDVRCQIGYEPVLHASSDVPNWVSEIMASFGYSSGSHYDRVMAYNTWARSHYGTNWAFSSFIEYNPPPAGTAFTDGYAAWAYLGGPYSNLLYRSFTWPFNTVYSHESGHIFKACDEYFQSGYGGCMSCGTCSHGINNGNCEYCNPQAVACMMRGNDDALCAYTPGHLGWLNGPIVKYSSHTIQDPTGNNNGMVDPGESVTMPLTLKNWGLPVTGVSATLTTADPYITISSNYSTFSNMVLDQTATGATAYAFSASPGTPNAHVATLTLNIVGSGYDSTSSFDIQIGLEPVLLVDDDNGYTYETYYQNALTAAGYGYYYWNVKTKGSPAVSDLIKRDVVVWFTSIERDLTLTGLDERNLTSYLNQGGTLFLSSQDYLLERFEDFAQDMLHVTTFTGETSSSTETGVTGDPISSGMSLGTNYVYPLMNYADDITPDGRSAAVFMNNTGYPGALRFPAVGTAPYKVVFFAFPFEAVADGTAPNNRATVMDKVIEWLMQPQDYQPPAVEVTSPDGGEEWASGTQHEITWVASDNVHVDSVSIFFSHDGGRSFPDTVAVREENDSTFTWVVPETPSDSCVIKVAAYDSWLNSSEDASDAFFRIPSPIGTGEVPRAVAFGLFQNYPNPFNPMTSIVFSLDRASSVSLRVFDVSGRLVRTLAEGPYAAGRHTVSWDGRDSSGKLAASGVYSYVLESDRKSAARKMVLLR